MRICLLFDLEEVKVKLLSRVRLFATLWTVAHQASPPMGFSRQEYWSGLPFPSPGDLPHPGIRPRDQTQVSRITGKCFNLWAKSSMVYALSTLVEGGLHTFPRSEISKLLLGPFGMHHDLTVTDSFIWKSSTLIFIDPSAPQSDSTPLPVFLQDLVQPSLLP